MKFNYSNYLLLKHRKVPAPPSITADNTNNSKLGINNQKLMLFNLGNRKIYYKVYIFNSSFLPLRAISLPL
ncbi:MAG: hypothetical protein O7D30_11015 [Rickettsia endosymbiont of Ixodes persulcatus]|nr:hypothetical protein [Rickettsia endosymbiont of Ixodes persulcatus]